MAFSYVKEGGFQTRIPEFLIKKTRPAIIVSDNALGKLPLKVIVPITDWKDRYQK